MNISLAQDRSLRSKDADGHMRVEESRISKANVCPYRGNEIPNWEALGLQPDRIYKLFRDPKELEKAAHSFDGKPLLMRHVPVSADLPQRELWVGTVGNCSFEAPYLIARPLMVLTKEAIRLIESGEQRELSAAYRYDAEMVPGVYGGQAYDGRMVNIRGNHVAIVSEGRAGPDVHVADEQPLEFRMKPRAAAAFKAIESFLGKDADIEKIQLAMDKSIWETPEESVVELSADEKDDAEKEALAKKREEHGEDAELDEEEREEAYERARDKKRGKDSKHGKDKKAKDSKAKDSKHGKDSMHRTTGQDAEPDHRKDFDPIKAKDELRAELKTELSKQFREAAVAREAVKPLVGVVSIAMDSAEEIYRFALERAGNPRAKTAHVEALPDMVEAALAAKTRTTRAPIAMDESQASLVDIDAIFGPKKAA